MTVISKATIITTVYVVEIIINTTVEAKLRNLLTGQQLSDRGYFQNIKRIMASIFYRTYLEIKPTSKWNLGFDPGLFFQ
jgi:hypothetical protein